MTSVHSVKITYQLLLPPPVAGFNLGNIRRNISLRNKDGAREPQPFQIQILTSLHTNADHGWRSSDDGENMALRTRELPRNIAPCGGTYVRVAVVMVVENSKFGHGPCLVPPQSTPPLAADFERPCSHFQLSDLRTPKHQRLARYLPEDLGV